MTTSGMSVSPLRVCSRRELPSANGFGAVPESLQSRNARQKRDPAVDAQELVERIDIPKTAGELRQMARETFGKYYGDKVQSELVHNFAKYGLVLHKGENNNVQIYGREDMFR